LIEVHKAIWLFGGDPPILGSLKDRTKKKSDEVPSATQANFSKDE